MLAADVAVEAMGVAGADIISDIRSKARTGGPAVYVLAVLTAVTTVQRILYVRKQLAAGP